MKRSRLAVTVARVVLAATPLIGACAASQPTSDDGAAEFVASIHQALSSADVTRVSVTITGAGIATPIQNDLSKVNGKWQGTIGAIPVGTSRDFHGDAFDSAGQRIYAGDAFANIVAGAKTAVALTLQQVNAPVPFSNSAPIIDSLVASSATVPPGAAITLNVAAHDPNVADVLVDTWSATGGSFSTTTALSTTWTAPATEGPQTLTIQVRDQKGAIGAMSFTVQVAASYARGSASLAASLNTWPEISSVNADPTRIDVGESTQLSLVATDADGDPLAYSWTATCAGHFSDPAAKEPRFTLDSLGPSDSCSLDVRATDGRGGANTGSLVIRLGAAPPATLAPAIDSTSQSSTTAGGGDRVTFRVTAHDPEGTALSYAWTASVGTLGGAVTSSEVVWTAPAGFGGHVDVTVVVTDASAVSTTQVFRVDSTTRDLLPVAPSATSFMWQTVQTQFIDPVSRAACTGRVTVAVSDHATCYTGSDDHLKCAGATYTTNYGLTFVDAAQVGVDQIILSPTFNTATGNFACVHRVDKTAQCFGTNNANGQFGTADALPSETWVQWGGPGTSVERIATGTSDQICATSATGVISCSGYNFGLTPTPQLGGGAFTTMWVDTFGAVHGDDPNVLRAAAGRAECQVTPTGLMCMGQNAALGAAGRVVDGGTVAIVLSPAQKYCWLQDDATVTCATPDTSRPRPYPLIYSSPFGAAGHVLALATNRYTTSICAVNDRGALWCLGDNARGQLGTGNYSSLTFATQVQPAGSVRTACQ